DALADVRGYLTVASNVLGELIAEVAARNRELLWNRTRAVSRQNLATLDAWCEKHAERLEWLSPRGSMTGFPRLRGVADARPFCTAAARRGVPVVPGGCFDAPAR